jgi:predicted phage-related endonuclease
MNITITNRITHDCAQGSDAWHALRAKHFTASEASAMLGVSKYETRAEPDEAQGNRPGRRDRRRHATPVRCRTCRRSRSAPDRGRHLGDDLYPVTMTADVNGLPLLASMDGLTMLGDIGWETKLLNQDLRAAVEAGTLDEHYTVQMEQQLMVAGLRAHLLHHDGRHAGEHLWRVVRVEPGAARAHRRRLAAVRRGRGRLRARVRAREAGRRCARSPARAADRSHRHGDGKQPCSLPRARLAVFGGIKTDLQTDADFADAEKTVKWCKEVEDRLDAAKQHALSQTASIDELFRTIDAIKEEARQKRLTLDKLVKAEKENRKSEIVAQARKAYGDHWSALCRRVGGEWIPAVGVSYFADAIKGLKSLDSMRDKVRPRSPTPRSKPTPSPTASTPTARRSRT